MKLTVKCANLNLDLPVDVEPTCTVAQLKDMLATRCTIPAENQRLIFAGRILKDAQTLDSYGIKDGQSLHLVKGSAQSPSSQRPAVPFPGAPPVAPAAPQQQPPVSAVPPNMFGAPQMMGQGGMQQMMQQMMGNPDMMRQMMDNPMVQQMMDNPELLRAMLTANPEMRALMDNNPELSHVLNDPQLLRQTMQMARNPDVLREMLRNSDRAMTNIENLPGGYDALRRVFTDVQQPMMDAMFQAPQGAEPARQHVAQPAQPPSEHPNAQPLPNPWAPAAPAVPVAGGPAAPDAGVGGAAPGGQMGDPLAAMTGMAPGALTQMLQNPGVQNVMQQMFQNPQLMRQLVDANPFARQMMQANPMMGNIIQDPAFLQQLANPNTLDALLRLQQPFGVPGTGSAPPPQQAPPSAAPFAAAVPQQARAPTAQPPQDPMQRFAQQIHQLEEMGFTDLQQNVDALVATNGNVQYAIERILGGGR